VNGGVAVARFPKQGMETLRPTGTARHGPPRGARQSSQQLETTVSYLGIEIADALAKSNKLTSDLPGQSREALPFPQHRSCARAAIRITAAERLNSDPSRSFSFACGAALPAPNETFTETRVNCRSGWIDDTQACLAGNVVRQQRHKTPGRRCRTRVIKRPTDRVKSRTERIPARRMTR
jgi:hypothetical protein